MKPAYIAASARMEVSVKRQAGLVTLYGAVHIDDKSLAPSLQLGDNGHWKVSLGSFKSKGPLRDNFLLQAKKSPVPLDVKVVMFCGEKGSNYVWIILKKPLPVKPGTFKGLGSPKAPDEIRPLGEVKSFFLLDADLGDIQPAEVAMVTLGTGGLKEQVRCTEPGYVWEVFAESGEYTAELPLSFAYSERPGLGYLDVSELPANLRRFVHNQKEGKVNYLTNFQGTFLPLCPPPLDDEFWENTPSMAPVAEFLSHIPESMRRPFVLLFAGKRVAGIGEVVEAAREATTGQTRSSSGTQDPQEREPRVWAFKKRGLWCEAGFRLYPIYAHSEIVVSENRFDLCDSPFEGNATYVFQDPEVAKAFCSGALTKVEARKHPAYVTRFNTRCDEDYHTFRARVLARLR